LGRIRVVKGMLRQIPKRKIIKDVISKVNPSSKIKKMFKNKGLRKRITDFMKEK